MNDHLSSPPADQQPELATEVIGAEGDLDGGAAVPDPADEQPISWQASEYVHHQKGPVWYVILAVIVLILCGVSAYFKSYFNIGLFVAMGAAIGVYAHKPPRSLTYALDGEGITIETKTYPFASFRSFAVISEPEWHSIELEPARRFMPRLTVLFDEDDFDAITGHLSLHLPRADRDPDLIERVTRYLRF